MSTEDPNKEEVVESNEKENKEEPPKKENEKLEQEDAVSKEKEETKPQEEEQDIEKEKEKEKEKENENEQQQKEKEVSKSNEKDMQERNEEEEKEEIKMDEIETKMEDDESSGPIDVVEHKLELSGIQKWSERVSVIQPKKLEEKKFEFQEKICPVACIRCNNKMFAQCNNNIFEPTGTHLHVQQAFAFIPSFVSTCVCVSFGNCFNLCVLFFLLFYIAYIQK